MDLDRLLELPNEFIVTFILNSLSNRWPQSVTDTITNRILTN